LYDYVRLSLVRQGSKNVIFSWGGTFMSKLKLAGLCSLALFVVFVLALHHARASRDTEAVSSPAVGGGADGTITIQLQPVLTTGLSSPLYVTNVRDGSNRLFIVQQGGIIKVLQPGATTPTDFLNITSRVLSGGERGLLGLAFHPQYTTNRRFFVYYTRVGDAAIQIAEYRVSLADPNVADTTETPIISVPHPINSNHNGGTVLFGPDGYLYFGPGDGGSANDPPQNAQNINQLLGKINRINVDGAAPYTSPTTNPFFGATPGADEIYMVGMRNPYRFSFDRGTGQLWIGDVGQGAREEIDIGQLGGNFGWRVYEGTLCTNLNPTECVPSNFVFPVAEYSHSAGRCSITGGHVYRGRRGTFPTGAYIYGDYCTGEIFMLQGMTQSLLLDTTLGISSFGEDEAGEIYVVGLGGSVNRLVNPNAPIPRNVVADFDGDLKTDPSVFRNTGVWYIRQSFTNSLRAFPWGSSGDTVTPGDFDGDGKTDAAVWRPAGGPGTQGTYYVLRSSNSTLLSQQWGLSGDFANVIADYDGDKKTDFAVYREGASAGQQSFFYYIRSVDGATVTVAWGTNGDVPVLGDYDGDGKNDPTIYRTGTNTYYVLSSANGASQVQQWGVFSTDDISPGDYDGDGKTDFAVFRHTGADAGFWYIRQSSDGLVRSVQFGTSNDYSVPGDYDGDGKYDLAVIREAAGTLNWYILNSNGNTFQQLQWGLAGGVDYAVPVYTTR
jgi:glucose/arabinose dehydrogenase